MISVPSVADVVLVAAMPHCTTDVQSLEILASKIGESLKVAIGVTPANPGSGPGQAPGSRACLFLDSAFRRNDGFCRNSLVFGPNDSARSAVNVFGCGYAALYY